MTAAGAPIGPGRPDTAVELLRAVAREHGDREAYVEAGRRITFAEWDRSADGVAAFLAEAGVGPGAVVALLLPSSIDYAVCYQAAMRLRAITSGVNPRLGPAEVASILERTAPRVVVVDDALEPPPGAGRVVRRSELSVAARSEPLSGRARPRPRPDDAVAIVWTSGTTGMPKGAVFDHENLRAVAAGAGELGARFDRRFAPIPFPHVGYMTRPWEEIEKVITTVIPPTPWTAIDTLRLLQDERVTVGQGVATQWRLVLDHPEFDRFDLSSLRIAGTGATAVPPELVREMQAKLGCPVVIGYTSTEAAITTGTRPGDSPELMARTVGRARDNVEVEVVDDEGRPVPAGVVGRVRCRSGAVMRGYWRDPERTAEVLSPDGWLTTGDLGALDDAGHLTLSGRRSEMYIRGGYNVYPVEVERVLSGHEAVAEVAVVGAPDPVLGEIGVAFVVPAPGATPELEPLRAAVRAVLADYKAPDRLVVLDSLPLTSVAKVDKRALSASLGAGGADPSA
jgi:acyl-CoA synthetase (AMP-forming)/AMP-acid ligase II